jgi:ferredoxin-thioredoxin reductase catalytic subunit
MAEKRWYHKYAEKNGLRINMEIEEMIHEGLERKKQMFGARYCPCKLVNTIENVCPCQEFRNEGHCHCGLFLESKTAG